MTASSLHLFSHSQSVITSEHRPIVIWHGLGDNYNSTGIHRFREIFDYYHPGINVYSISLNDDPSKDQQLSMFGDANDEVDDVCRQLCETHALAHGFDAIGLSQGGVFLRALVERCAQVDVHTLVTFGSPHMGVSELPLCDENDWVCKRRNSWMKSQVWRDIVQKRVIPAQYFRDPNQIDDYLAYSNFLADINNERESKAEVYQKRFRLLEKLILVSFLKDTTVVPKQSSKFGDVGIWGQEIEWKDTPLYQDDYIGLRQLDEAGKVEFLEIDDDHMRISDEDIGKVAQLL